MRYLVILFLIINFGLVYSQTDENMKVNIDENYKRDSIRIENIIEFYKYSDKHTDSIEVVRFKIKITNLGNQPIPNFENVQVRSKCLTLYINGKDSHDMNIQNGVGPNKIQYLQKNESDTFETNWILNANSGIKGYGNPIEIMWTYLGIHSEILVVDIVNKNVKY